MSYLLDTSICSAYLKGKGRVFNRFVQHAGHLHISAVVLGELYVWVYRARTNPAYVQAVEDLLKVVHVLPMDRDVAYRFGRIRAAQFDAGRLTPELDLIIGSTALVHDLTLVTGNVQDFVSIPGLRIENWLTS